MRVKNKIYEKSRTIISDYDIHLFHEGTHYNCYKFMGAHYVKEDRRWGVRFTVWAPKATEVRVVGEFNDWQSKKEYSFKRLNDEGLWSLFVPGLKENFIYKYEITQKSGKKVLKADPYAIYSEKRPNTASYAVKRKNFRWGDKRWLEYRNSQNIYENPINIYEVHLGSWRRDEKGEFLNYREIGDKLASYVKSMGYTHVELMPVMEHPLDDSWGYQLTGYYSVTSRYGTIDDFKYLINTLHKTGIGVILDWVPGHFCKDEHGLYRFDGTPTYEYEDVNKAENRGWGAANFDLGKPEVRNFLISNALFWLREYHIDGLRVDAVTNMLYLNYDRKEGEWTPNKNGGSENLEAIEFFKELSKSLFKEVPNLLMIAEESTSWPMITKPTDIGGVGFNFKWNMGWMNDILEYISLDPVYRKHHHNRITFSIMYNYSENFILPLSHDEVVHGKKSLIDKMWGDYWNKFAGLRLFMAYMFTHPGKKSTFMGTEFAQFIEWRHYEELEWKLIESFEIHKSTQEFFRDLNNLYRKEKALWLYDYKFEGFKWIDADNSNQSILIFMRKTNVPQETLIIICNFTPMVYYDYKIGVPYLGEYKELLNTDSKKYGGSGQTMESTLYAEKKAWHKEPYHIKIKVPPMAAVILKVNKIYKLNDKKHKEIIEIITDDENKRNKQDIKEVVNKKDKNERKVE
ncbi:1,4-alpha-glucan branching protein GlgB [Clostridium aciditolerans]|uniref:1,4-alpha-glucan branching enzyme GlgB n=1 Tax=Clostridium aciditolerans TaxID=339861 RepID=A0A934HW50_9CLOT|nr:1,4-alpha-glucan branching protein GlgB [Clostridium aciditolerans]MBI6872439.1 1,4-alpha-glucan branching protein GlgB [Clostridium aciditolerans]